MRFRPHIASCIGVAILLAGTPCAPSPQPARDKSVWNYDGGILFITDGSLSEGPCFRISGRVTAPTFFDNLKRVNSDAGATFRRGTETLTQFPDQVFLAFIVYDHPCPAQLEHTATRTYLTRPLMNSLHLYLYWKRGVELRPINDVQPKYFSVDPVVTHTASRTQDPPPEKFEWSYEFAVPSAGVPLTDSLVLILRTPDGHIAARVAARM
jgi:hypothetical protein